MTTLKRRFGERSDLVGAWLSIGHPAVAEITAAQGFDFVLVDTEHTTMGLDTVENMSRAVDAADGDTRMLVRVPWNDPVRIKRVLDIGVAGVMVPMVESAQEARQVVDAVQYPPSGSRGVASGRAAEYGDEFQAYVESANESVTTVVQIETQTGLDNAAEIAAVEGIDALFVGPADLSANLGVFGEWESQRLGDAMENVIDVAAAAGVSVGTLVIDPEDIGTRIQQGFDYLIVGKDTNHLAEGNRSVRRRYEEAVSRRADSSTVQD